MGSVGRGGRGGGQQQTAGEWGGGGGCQGRRAAGKASARSGTSIAPYILFPQHIRYRSQQLKMELHHTTLQSRGDEAMLAAVAKLGHAPRLVTCRSNFEDLVMPGSARSAESVEKLRVMTAEVAYVTVLTSFPAG